MVRSVSSKGKSEIRSKKNHDANLGSDCDSLIEKDRVDEQRDNPLPMPNGQVGVILNELRNFVLDALRRSCSPWLRASELPEYFRSVDLAKRCTGGGWLNPVLQGKRRTIYRLADVLVCLRRIEAGELPPARRRRVSGN